MGNTYFICENVFSVNAPYYHYFSTPPEKELLFLLEDDYQAATNMIAVAAMMTGCRVLAYAIMSNHLHFILAGSKDECEAFIRELLKRLNMFLRRCRRPTFDVGFNTVEISDLKQMRDEVAYVIRNPYAARNDVNPFSYPWCTGYLYFNSMLPLCPQGIPASELSIRASRAIKWGRDCRLPSTLRVADGMILPSSFVDYKLVESLFENARHFVWWITRNVESYTATAARLGESSLLTDEEAYMIAIKCCKTEFGTDNPRLLPQNHKQQLIRSLKQEYGATNKQLSRCTGIPLTFINEMFPPRNL